MAHQAAKASQLSDHDDFQLAISAARRIYEIYDESETSSTVKGEGTKYMKSKRVNTEFF